MGIHEFLTERIPEDIVFAMEASKRNAELPAMRGELEPSHAFHSDGGEVRGLRVDEHMPVHLGHFDDARIEAAAVRMERDLAGLRRRGNGGIKNGSLLRPAGKGCPPAVDPRIDGAERS